MRRKMPWNDWHFPFLFFRVPGLRTKTEFIGFAGGRTQTLPLPGPPFRLLPVRWFAYENRVHWLCGRSYANPIVARAAFPPPSGPVVCVRKPSSLAFRVDVRKACRCPGRLSASFRPGGLRTKTEFIGFSGGRTQTLSLPGSPFRLLPVRWFAYENRIQWLCERAYANPAAAWDFKGTTNMENTKG